VQVSENVMPRPTAALSGPFLADRPNLARRFAREQRALMVRQGRLISWFCIVLMPLFHLLDLIFLPHLVAPLRIIRVTVVILVMLGLLALRRRFGRRHVVAISLFGTIQAAIGIAIMTALDSGGSSPYYAGINVAMFCAAVILPWEVRVSVTAVLAMVGSYALICLTWGGVPEPRVFALNLFFLGATGLVTVASHHTTTRARRRDFEHRIAIEQARRDRVAFLANIKRERDRLNAIMRAMRDCVIVLDGTSRIETANAAASTLLGYGVAELAGMPVGAILENGTIQRRDESCAVSLELRARDGTVIPVTCSTSPIHDPGGASAGLLIVARDMREAQRLQRLEAAAELAEERERVAALKTRFVTNASHEFRTPLAVILSAADVLGRYDGNLLPAQRRERLEKIRGAVRQMTELLDGVLSMGRLNNGSLPCVLVEVEVRALCQELLADATVTASPMHQLVFTCDAAVPAHVPLDPNLVRPILRNLLSNALKYSPDGGTVELAVAPEASGLAFRVTDQGIGIPWEDQEHLFEAFHRAGNVGRIAGVGLGLAIVHSAVESHGGTIRVESAPARGTTFVVMLPCRTARPELAAASA